MDFSRETASEMYRRMFRSRSFELAAIEKLKIGKIPGALHTSVGQEASIVGSCLALRDDDYMVGNHRSHGHPIGKGARVDRLFAELMGKATGINSGMGGSMHLSDFGVGSLGETSIVGSGLPVAAGAALGSKMQGTDRVTLCFFGDGASNEGTFHESLNLAAIRGRVHRRCGRRRDGRHAADRGPDADLLHVLRDGPDHQHHLQVHLPVRGPGQPAADDPCVDVLRRLQRRAAQRPADSPVHGQPWPQDRRAEQPVRRQGPAESGHPRGRPGHQLRRRHAVDDDRRRPGRGLHRPARAGGREARGLRGDRRRDIRRGQGRPGSRRPAGQRGRLRGSGRPALARPDGLRHDPELGGRSWR